MNVSKHSAIVKKIKCLADAKKHITDDDIEAVIIDKIITITSNWKIVSISIKSASKTKSDANISMTNKNKKYISRKSSGNGPIDAIYNCINQIIGVSTKLKIYKVDSITSGFDALGRVTVKITDSDNKTLITGYSTHTDIIMASANAYVNAINRMLYKD